MRNVNLELNCACGVTLTGYLQETGGEFGFERRPAILILPGGGYVMCSDREADPVAMEYLAAGYQTFILRYSVKSAAPWPQPLNDYEAAMEQILMHVDDWNIDKDKIALVGFSAGGHLAACAATMAEHRPAAAILLYPALLSDALALCQPGLPEPAKSVSRGTSPCFLAACRDDPIASVQNTLELELALLAHDIPFESHIYSYGGHGFSTGKSYLNAVALSDRVSDWVPDSIGWLRERFGALGPKGFGSAELQDWDSGSNERFSVDSSLGFAREHDAELHSVLRPLYNQMEAVAAEKGWGLETLMNAMGNSSLKSLMEMLGWTSEEIQSIDLKLKRTEP